MVHKSSQFSTQQLGEKLTQTLGQSLLKQELSNWIKQFTLSPCQHFTIQLRLINYQGAILC